MTSFFMITEQQILWNPMVKMQN